MIKIPAYVIEEAIDEYILEMTGKEGFWTVLDVRDAQGNSPMLILDCEDSFGDKMEIPE